MRPSFGTDSVLMYSVCTGPSPGGGAYWMGKPGSGSTVVRYQRNAPTPAIADSASTHATPVIDWPRMRSHSYVHGTSTRSGVGTSTPARSVTGVRGDSPAASNSTDRPSVTRPMHGVPTPNPTEHCAPVTSPGSVTRTRTRSMSLFHDGATTFQKNVEVEFGSPVDDAKGSWSPVVPGSSTPAMVYRSS